MPPEDTDIRVVVVADDHLARAGLAALLGDQPGCIVAGQTDPAQFASADPDLYRADVAVWDLGWQPERSLEYLADAANTGVPNVVLVADDTVAAEATAAGARGVLHREVEPQTLMAALAAVIRGLAVLDSQLTDAASPSQDEVTPPATIDLTARERDVLPLIAEGFANKAIAQRLGISDHTVKFHVNSILNKLGAQSRTEAVTLAIRAGLITL